jgi:protein SCO1/2
MVRASLLLAVLLLPIAPMAADAHSADAGGAGGAAERLPVMGPAPVFTLTDQDVRPVALHDLRGKVVAVTFIYTTCPDVCPMLTANMAQVQEDLGPAFGRSVAFLSITTDPDRDTPQVLKRYGEAFGADPQGWSFLTGDPALLASTGRRYGIFLSKRADGQIDHTLLTSLIDRKGRLRVQYAGARFDLEEFRRDLLELVAEPQ